MIQKSLNVEIKKVDESLGVVFGYGIVCLQKNDEGEFNAYEDLQGDHIPETTMLYAVQDFMAGTRIAKHQHSGDPIGKIVFGLPVTKDLCKSLGWDVPATGFVLGMKPDSDQILKDARDGKLTGFSLGGHIIV